MYIYVYICIYMYIYIYICIYIYINYVQERIWTNSFYNICVSFHKEPKKCPYMEQSTE